MRVIYKQLIGKVSEATGFPRSLVRGIVDTTLSVIKQELSKGNSVVLHKFASLNPATCYNHRRGTHYTRVRVRQSESLKKVVRNTVLEND